MVANYKLLKISCKLIPCSLFPIPYSLFPITYYLLPITYYLLPITYSRPQSVPHVTDQSYMSVPSAENNPLIGTWKLNRMCYIMSDRLTII
jgi:hypothetical protein